MILLLLLLGCPWTAPEPVAPPEAAAAAFYTCPMHPSVHQEHPGRCALCGMDLVAVSPAEAEAGAVVLDAGTRARVGILTEPATLGPLTRELRATGTVVLDPTRAAEASLRVDTWVRTVDAAPGDHVRAGQRVLTVYAPELAATQAEVLHAHQAGRAEVVAAARRRLASWGVGATEVDALVAAAGPAEAIALRSPADGVLGELPAVGSMVPMGMALFRVAAVDRVWVEAALPAGERAPAVGAPARVGLPDGEVETEVVAVLAEVDPVTRGPRFRVQLDRALPAGQYLPVVVPEDLGERLTVPAGAVVHAGERDLVFVALDDRLTPREVELGVRAGERVEVRAGLVAGEVVVTRGAFLVGAESRLRSSGAW